MTASGQYEICSSSFDALAAANPMNPSLVLFLKKGLMYIT